MAGSKKDFTQAAFDVFQQAIGEAEKPMPLTGRKANSSKGGKIGGAKRAESMTEEQRAEQAKKAADARWASTPPRKRRAKVSLNEAITTDLVRDYLRKLGYDNDKSIVIEREKTADSQIDKLLQTASKKGSGIGRPDFIITSPQTVKNLVCVVECKADVAKHKSDTLTKYADYAVDGAKLYATYLSKEKDVLYIGVSGQNEQELRVNHYLQLKNEKPAEVFNPNKLYPFKDYIEQYKKARFRVDYEALIKYTRDLNGELHKKKIPEHNRAILFSGILIALEDDTFHDTFASYTNAKRLSDFLVESVTQKLEYANIPKTRVHEMQQAYNFIKSHTALIDEGYLITLVSEIHKEVRPFIKSNQHFDIISHCYVEFLKYANNDSGLGIVLTPAHITELFCELANVTKDSVVLDNCCGTSSFLIAAMQKMITQANGDQTEIEKIKKERLVGIEYQDHIFTLAVSNMIIHGDGKTNIIKGDCFKKIQDTHKYKPTVGLLNPPYNDVTGIDELVFIENNLSAIEKNGIVVAIVPMRCALYQDGQGDILKQRLLDSHTLEAVMSMPDDLFYPVGTVTCVMVFRAQIPHAVSNKKTWFGYWKSDGFAKVKHRGRVDANNLWQSIKSHWLEMYRNRESKAGESILQYVGAKDEWCAEAYMETDYSQLSQSSFEESVKKFIAFNLISSQET